MFVSQLGWTASLWGVSTFIDINMQRRWNAPLSRRRLFLSASHSMIDFLFFSFLFSYMHLMTQNHSGGNGKLNTSCTVWLHNQLGPKVLARRSFLSDLYGGLDLNLISNEICQLKAQCLWEQRSAEPLESQGEISYMCGEVLADGECRRATRLIYSNNAVNKRWHVY